MQGVLGEISGIDLKSFVRRYRSEGLALGYKRLFFVIRRDFAFRSKALPATMLHEQS